MDSFIQNIARDVGDSGRGHFFEVDVVRQRERQKRADSPFIAQRQFLYFAVLTLIVSLRTSVDI